MLTWLGIVTIGALLGLILLRVTSVESVRSAAL
jgi:hypothetical protein